jgi:hypothetical protein
MAAMFPGIEYVQEGNSLKIRRKNTNTSSSSSSSSPQPIDMSTILTQFQTLMGGSQNIDMPHLMSSLQEMLANDNSNNNNSSNSSNRSRNSSNPTYSSFEDPSRGQVSIDVSQYNDIDSLCTPASLLTSTTTLPGYVELKDQLKKFHGEHSAETKALAQGFQ